MSKKREIKTVNQWMDADEIPGGYTLANAMLRREFNRLAAALRMQNGFLYFLGVEMEIRYVTKMMWSAKRQARFCETVSARLNQKRVEQEHIPIFRDCIKSIEKRLKTIERITKEDIHLTKYEPFFEAEMYGKDIKEIDFESIKAMADAWNEEHKDEVEKHMAEIQPELDRYEAFKDRKHKAIKAEKEGRKAKKKAENAYVRELRENEKKHKREQERIDKSFDYYYK